MKTKPSLPASTSMMVVADSIKKKAQPLIKKIETFIIKTREAYDESAKIIAQLKEFSKEAERQERTLTEPAKAIIKSAQEIFKPFRTRVMELEGMVKIRMLEFQARQEKLSAKIGADFESGKIKKLNTVVSKQNELLNTSSENAQLRKVWTLTIEDVSQVPKKYMVPDEVLIKQAFKNGQKVAGCKWEQVNQIAI